MLSIKALIHQLRVLQVIDNSPFLLDF